MTFDTFACVILLSLSFTCFLLHILCRYVSRKALDENVTSLKLLPSTDFWKFQRKFLLVYYLALLGDWLQGPYVYELYRHYGYEESEIALIYVAGFASSLTLGTLCGPLADIRGRRFVCWLYCFLYSICCLTKLSNRLHILLIGRILGGVATCMLWTSFETWYVHEHVTSRGFPSCWLTHTFSAGTFGNGLVAIVAGLLSQISAEWLSFGPVAPFMLAIPSLILCAFTIRQQNWAENYGESGLRRLKLGNTADDKYFSINRDMIVSAFCLIIRDPTTRCLAIIQSLFESIMYMFVFVWTPALENQFPNESVPLGVVFACFMVSIMIGSASYTLVISFVTSSSLINRYSQRALQGSVALSFCSFIGCCLATSKICLFIFFLVYEICIGAYFPLMAYFRSQAIADDQRSTVMNWFRVPMNLLTCVGLIWLYYNHASNQLVFRVCAALLVGTFLTTRKFSSLIDRKLSEQIS